VDVVGIFVGHHSQGIIDPRALLSQIPGFNGRYSQYVRRAIANIRQVQGLDLPEVPEPDNGLGTWTPLQALAVLTYGPSSHLNAALIAEIEQLTEQSVQREEGQSRFEVAFYVEYLAPLVSYFQVQQPGLRLEVIPQFSCGPYRVDFRVNLQWFDPNGKYFDQPTRQETYLLEFDEAYHLEPSNRQADQQRDAYIEQQTGLRPLRIRHEEQELWATICRAQGRILSVEEYLQGLLVAMAEPGDGRHLDITRDSAQSAYTCDPAGYLRYPAQPGRDLKAIAERLGWRLSQRHSGNLAYHRLTPPRVTANRHILG
jgi:very-short-patch-repair endonuclease